MKRKYVQPLTNYPEKIQFEFLHDPSDVCDIDMTIADYAKLCLDINSDVFEQEIDKNSKPLNCLLFAATKTEKCVNCLANLNNDRNRRRISITCNVCGLIYSRSAKVISKVASSKSSRKKHLLQRYICVTDGDAKLLVPPINYYPGELSRVIFKHVQSLLDAKRNNEKVYHDTKRQKFIRESHITLNVASRNGSSSDGCLNIESIASDKKFADSHRTRFVDPKKHLHTIQNKGNQNDSYIRKGRNSRNKKLKLLDPQYAVTQIPILCSSYSTRLRCGKANEFRRLAMGGTKRNCMRLTIGTNGALRAGEIYLPDEAMKRTCSSREFVVTRYPVLGEGNMIFAKATECGVRTTGDIPSSQCKYNGADNDGDQVNFIPLFHGLLANAAVEYECLNAPWHNMGNNGELKMEFDSDAKIGLGKQWKRIISDLLAYQTITNDSRGTYDMFCEYEAKGRELSPFVGVFSLLNLSRNSDCRTGLKRMIECEAIPRFTQNHFEQATNSIGYQSFYYNEHPVLDYIDSSFVDGLTPVEFIASCQSSIDTIANQNSSQMSSQGNMQYQCQWCLRPAVVDFNRMSVTNPVTKRLITPYVCTLNAIVQPLTEMKTLSEAAKLFAELVCGYNSAKSSSIDAKTLKRIQDEAVQYKRLYPETN